MGKQMRELSVPIGGLMAAWKFFRGSGAELTCATCQPGSSSAVPENAGRNAMGKRVWELSVTSDRLKAA